MATVHVPAVSPRELTGTTALQPGIPPEARCGCTNTGHGLYQHAEHEQRGGSSHCCCRCGSFSLVSTSKSWWMLSCPLPWSWHAKATAPTLWMCSVICWTRPRPSSTTLATTSRTLLNFSMLQQSLEDLLAQLNKAKADMAESTTSLDAEKADLVEVEKSLSVSVASQVLSKSTCVQVASEHEAPVKGFAEEMKALADATQVFHSETGGVEEQLRFRDVDTPRRSSTSPSWRRSGTGANC